jgi:4-hydroxythreonine-4-phosphate dehydrogenase
MTGSPPRKDQHPRSPLLALTMGDPAGIGLEITLEIRRKAAAGEGAASYAVVLYADPGAVSLYANRAGEADPTVVISDIAEARELWPARLPVVPVATAAPIEPGRPDVANAPAVIAAIEAATSAVVGGEAAAVVTNPLAKSVLQAAGFPHPGHTEFLAELAVRLAGGRSYRPVMMLAADELRVVPLTVHVPLAAVPRFLKPELIVETVEILDTALVRDFGLASGRRPRIAVAGLNPHAGENGTLGREEQQVIAPALSGLRERGYDVTGPHSADTLFHEAARSGYDAVLAMYHDQGLIPIKTLAFDRAVNVTLGLPFIRTSPDHGTAFDIAGKGLASASSLAHALELAARLSSNRARSPARRGA